MKLHPKTNVQIKKYNQRMKRRITWVLLKMKQNIFTNLFFIKTIISLMNQLHSAHIILNIYPKTFIQNIIDEYFPIGKQIVSIDDIKADKESEDELLSRELSPFMQQIIDEYNQLIKTSSHIVIKSMELRLDILF